MSTAQTPPPTKSGPPTWVKVLVPIIGLGGLAVTGVAVAILVFVLTAWLNLPLPVFGFDDPPVQPIAFPHTSHAGTDVLLDINGDARIMPDGSQIKGMGLDCTFCHRTVTTSGSAGVPPVQLCSFCHRVVGSEDKVGLTQLRDISFLEPFVDAINWQRVHRLPDSVRFVHDPHIRFLSEHPAAIGNNDAVNGLESVSPSQVCSTCHGDIATMEKVKQVEPLKMGQCVNCHRDNNAPVDCSTCHF